MLSREQEGIYLELCPQLLHDAAVLMLDTGLGPAEALGLQWSDIHPDYLQVREGKTRYRARSLSLTSRLRSMLEVRRRDSTSKFVFAGGSGKPPLPSSLAHLHAQVRRRLKLPQVFVLYSLRHRALTPRGNGALTPTPSCELLGTRRSPPRSARSPSSETVGLAIARLDAANRQALQQAASGKGTGTRTDTVLASLSVSH